MRGACFITGDYDPSGGVIDLDIFVDSMQPWGRLCISPKAVRMLVTTLGLEWPTDDFTEQLDDMVDRNEALRDENRRLREALAHVIRAGELAKLGTWADELVAT